MEKHEIAEVLKKLGLDVTFEFVPFSKSRNYKKGATVSAMSLNYKGHIYKDDKEIAVVDYSMGISHCPSYVQSWNGRLTVDEAKFITKECEEGRSYKGTERNFFNPAKLKPILPDPVDFFYSISMDCDAIESATFEEWAEEFGFNPDSRKDEAIYKACLETALKINRAIGSEGLRELREAYQDY